MGATGRLAAVVLASIMLAGCSETGFQDWFGAGKYIPDESQVQQGQVLSTPPDLGLRPPGDGQQPVQQAYQPPPPASQPPAQQPAAQQAGQGQAPIYQPQQVYQAPPPQQQAVDQAPPQPAYQAPQQQAPQGPQQLQPQATTDIYANWGVSRYKPDGTAKTQAELNAEMSQKRIEMEKAKNPNYGTIFNMGSIWTDG